jgi:hypothetical protein
MINLPRYENGNFTPEYYPDGILIEVCNARGLMIGAIHWDFHVKAPITNIMAVDDIGGEGEAFEYLNNNGYYLDSAARILTLPLLLLSPSPRNYSEVLQEVIRDNHAGPNGEYLTWDQILFHYSNKNKSKV